MQFNPGLEIGRGLSNRELSELFKCSTQGGMRKSNTTNTLVLIYRPSSIYADRWKKDVLYYTGMGQKGDQQLSGQNRDLYDSDKNNIGIFLFETTDENKYIYKGQVQLAATPYQEDQKDIDGNNRKVWIFPIIVKEKKKIVFNEVLALLEKKKQIILYGPPGTGKTYFARQYAVDFIERGEGFE